MKNNHGTEPTRFMVQENHAAISIEYERGFRDRYHHVHGPTFCGSISLSSDRQCFVNCTGSYGCKDSSLFVGTPGSSGKIPFTIASFEVFTHI